MQVFTSSTYKEEPTEDLALHIWEAFFTTKRREK